MRLSSSTLSFAAVMLLFNFPQQATAGPRLAGLFQVSDNSVPPNIDEPLDPQSGRLQLSDLIKEQNHWLRTWAKRTREAEEVLRLAEARINKMEFQPTQRLDLLRPMTPEERAVEVEDRRQQMRQFKLERDFEYAIASVESDKLSIKAGEALLKYLHVSEKIRQFDDETPKR